MKRAAVIGLLLLSLINNEIVSLTVLVIASAVGLLVILNEAAERRE